MSAIFRRAASNATRSRLFSTSTVARKGDLVQDLYLKEIKAYKPAPVAQDAHVGQVKQYSAPAAPKAPSLPSDMSSELSAYTSSEPSLADAPKPTSSATAGEENVSGADAYLSFLEQDLPKREEHHH